MRSAVHYFMLLVIFLVVALRMIQPGHAAEGVGGAVGASLAWEPKETPGVAASLSALITHIEEAPAFLHLRGEVIGLVAQQNWALMPTLTGDLGGSIGWLEGFFTGGIELFGFAQRGDYTFFTALGLIGGAGIAVRLHPAVWFDLRGLVAWMPAATAARIEEPQGEHGSLPTLLSSAVLIGIVYWPSGDGRASKTQGFSAW